MLGGEYDKNVTIGEYFTEKTQQHIKSRQKRKNYEKTIFTNITANRLRANTEHDL